MLPGFSLHGPNGELANLVEAGLTAFEALSAATRSAAEFLRLEREIGTIAPGKRADLVLLDADPLADVRNAAKIAGVMVRGRYFPKAELDRLLDEQAARYATPRDRFAGLPALPKDGTSEVDATFEIRCEGYAVGSERLTRRRLADGSRILSSQSSIDPWWETRTSLRLETGADGIDRKLEIERESIDGTAHLRLERRGDRSHATGSRPAYGAIEFDEPLPPGTLFGGPILSNGFASDMTVTFVHALPAIADMAVGDSRELRFRLIELNSAEFFRNATLGDMTWTVRRDADETAPAATRVFRVTTNGRAGRGGYDATIRIEPGAAAPLEIRAGEGNWQPWTYRRL
ncbi:MAG: amidohydrolase family protein [Planctomycetes bacterium]|nr:amidohydrolase family protein [Planctomycetota bacterium]